jgi:peptidoglycan/xylan/chitin deacetylase (PgdA/CDA1 family)
VTGPALVPVLLYHSVAPGATPEQRGWVTAPEVFADHMACLAAGGYRTLSVSEYAAMLAEPSPDTSAPTVVITFDDGFADFTRHALPVLTDHHLTATMYVVTGCVGGTASWLDSIGEDDRPMLGWSEINALAGAGIEVGAHTHSHPQLDIIDRGAAWDEIRRSRGVLEDRIGRPVRTFAYPFGFHGPRIRALVARAGFTSACAVKDAISGPGDDPFAIARVIVPGDADVSTLNDLLVGEGRPRAWRRERASTKAFRVARRCAARGRRLRAAYARTRLGGRIGAGGAEPPRPTLGP